MAYDAFWRWYDRAARLDFAGTIVSTVVSAVIGGVAFVEGWDRLAILLAIFIAFAAVALVYLAFCDFWDRFDKASLKYLNALDSQLGPSIITMARQSAWGRWYAAQHLVNARSRIGEQHLYQTAAGIVMEEIANGSLEIRGRRPNPKQLGYEPIDRTHWRSSWLLCVQDRAALWKIILGPKGGVELDHNGSIVRVDDATAAQRTSLLDYDELIVDAYQFEGLWPKRQKVADAKRRKFLRQARRLGLDKDEIQRLS